MSARYALLCLLIALMAAVPGFAFGSSLLFEIDRVVFILFLAAAVVLFVVTYVRGATP
jgi:uncharacterized membrane protein YtjA (UPF0391 family)